MIRLTVRYDGKVLIPEEPVTLPVNVPLLITVDMPESKPKVDALLALDGLGAEIWKGIDPLEYQRQERSGWPDE